MFHIVLSADENYIKFAAVLINSIIKNTDTSKKFKDFCDKKGFSAGENSILKDYECVKFENLSEDERSEGYVFHILSDFVSEKSREKLSNLALKLSEIYPCEIKICIISDEIFRKDKVPLWRGNYQAYYLLLLQRALNERIKICLALDIDMLCLGDVREYFAIDLKDKIVGAVLDKNCLNHIIFTPQDKSKANKEVILNQTYINTGMCLVNLRLWREAQIEQECLEILKEYCPMLADQCTLSAVLAGRVLALPLKFNYLNFITPRYRNYPYNESEILYGLENIVVIHLLNPKPWRVFFVGVNENLTMKFSERSNALTSQYLSLWWDYALKTPYFDKDLLFLNLELKNEALKKYANDLAAKLNDKFKALNAENLSLKKEAQILQKERQQRLMGAKARVQSSLSYKIGLEIMKAYKSGLLALLKLPFVLRKLQKEHLRKKKFLADLACFAPDLSAQLKPVKLEEMLDFKEAQRVKEHLAFKLGQAFLKGYRARFSGGLVKFYFEAKGLQKEFEVKVTKLEI